MQFTTCYALLVYCTFCTFDTLTHSTSTHPLTSPCLSPSTSHLGLLLTYCYCVPQRTTCASNCSQHTHAVHAVAHSVAIPQCHICISLLVSRDQYMPTTSHLAQCHYFAYYIAFNHAHFVCLYFAVSLYAIPGHLPRIRRAAEFP